MKFSTAAMAASLCVVGSASAFVFPVTVRTATRAQAGRALDADMIRAREKLISSPQMTELLNLVNILEPDETSDEPAEAPPAPEAADESE